jgi:single-strand DNA-binding protein
MNPLNLTPSATENRSAVEDLQFPYDAVTAYNLKFGLAVNRQFRDEAGGTREETTFVDLEAWGKTGELFSKYLSKRSPAMVEGRLRFDSWESKAGEKRNKLKVVVDNVQFLSSRGEGGSKESSAPEGRQSTPQREAPASESQGNDVDDDVPF